RLRVTGAVCDSARALRGRIRELKAALAGEVEVNFVVAPEPTWRPLSRLSVALVVVGILLAAAPGIGKTLGIAHPGVAIQAIGGTIAVIGLVLAGFALWMRRSYRMQTQMRDVEIDRRLRGRSDMEAELKDVEARAAAQLGAIGLPNLAAAE